MLDYMYLGEITVDENKLDHFMALVKDFGIVGFESYLQDYLSLNNKFQAKEEYLQDQDEEIKNDSQVQRDIYEHISKFIEDRVGI